MNTDQNTPTTVGADPITVRRLADISAGDRERIMKRAHGDFGNVLPLVEQIMDDVRDRGDAALKEYTERFDKARLDDLQVSDEEFEQASRTVPGELLRALDEASHNITAFHSKHIGREERIETRPGVKVWRAWRAVEKVGIYVPGGKAAYPSSVLMNVIPARIAGCREIVICTPPDRAGKVSPAILAAADLLGARRIYKLGGAQAIAALSYGSETVPCVYKLFGAGNRFVTTAKLLAASRGLAAIDMPAGPTELLVIAGPAANPAFVAADMIAQAEHAEDSASVLLTTSDQLGAAVVGELTRQLEGLPTRKMVEDSLRRYGLIAVVADLDEAMAFTNEYAPEHLSIVTDDDEAVLQGINNAGSVFLGPWSAQPAGDYAAGTNHVLPTGGYAAMFGPLSVESFGRKLQIQQLSEAGLGGLRFAATTMARHEGLPGHGAAIERRFEGAADKALASGGTPA